MVASVVNHAVKCTGGVPLTSHIGVNGSAVYERTVDPWLSIKVIGAIADDAVKCSTDHGPYVLMTSPLALGMPTTEFIELELVIESDWPRDVTTVTWVEVDVAVVG